MIARTTVELFETEVILVTNQRDYRREVRALAGDNDADHPGWHSVGLCREFHSGDGEDGQRSAGRTTPSSSPATSSRSAGRRRRPRYVVLVCLDERIRAGDPEHARKVVVHEAVHAAAMILDHVAHRYDGGDEPLAHLTAHLWEWLEHKAG